MIESLLRRRATNDQMNEAELRVLLGCLRQTIEEGVQGDIVELGCYTGATSVLMGQLLATMRQSERRLWLYDSFAGLPEKTPEDDSPAGLQFRAGELLASRSVVERRFKQAGLPRPRIKKAWFSDLTPRDMPSVIAFAFLDGDYYESVRDSLQLVWPLLQPGATVVVDDYANEALPGAAHAVDEWRQSHPCRLHVEASLAVLTMTACV